MPDRLFIGRLEIVDVQHLARTGGLGKARQQSLFRRKRHVLALAPADRFRLERLDPAAVIGHVRAVHGAPRNADRLRDRGLRHSALAQQHHLDALALRRRDFPSQRCFQLPDLLLGALDHPSPRIRQPKRIISRALMRDRKTPKIPRFKQLWKRYNREVASRLNLTEGTIKAHLHNIYQKLTISNRTALATLAVSECEHDVISELQGAHG